MGWKSIGVALLALAVAGCNDPETEYRLTGATYSFNITGCLGLPGESACVSRMREVASEIRGCVVLESGAGERDAAEITFDENGQIAGNAPLQVTLNSTLEAGLFVFDAVGGDALARCLGGGFGPRDMCTGDMGCVLKLYQTPIPGPEAAPGADGGAGFSEINFRTAGPDSPCDVQWAGGPPTALCPEGDDDCDGNADETVDAAGNPVGLGQPCGDGGGGANACEVVWTCADNGLNAICPDAGAGADEVCDGVDNDCDGETDEGLPDCCPEPSTTRVCNTESDCPDGEQICGDDRRWGPCLDPMTMMPIAAVAAETCNSTDDDCDGFVDEDFALGGPGGPTTGAECDVLDPPTACQTRGRVICETDFSATCQPDAVEPQDELCDGVDNDCDGSTDEGVQPVECWGGVADEFQGADGQGVGRCAPGRQSCVDGDFGPCVGVVGPTEAICQPRDAEQIDEDCDDEADEGLSPVCGLCPAEYQDAVELCGGGDEDCDGNTDEDTGAQVAGDPANCGRCGNDCNVQGQEPNRITLNADFACEAAECVFLACQPGFADLEPAEPDGNCECEVSDESIGFEDLDCDGVEGASRNNNYFFVAPSIGNVDDQIGASHIGRSAGNIPGAPFNSLDQALARIEDQRSDGSPPAPITIVLETGVYELPDGFDVPDGVSILGGYRYANGDRLDLPPIPVSERNGALARAHGWTRIPLAGAAGDADKTILTGHHVLLRYAGLEQETVLDNVEVQATNAPDDGGSSAAVVARDVRGHLSISNSRLVAGNGANGADGTDGAGGERQAEDGDAGTDNDDNPAGLGGAGAPAPRCVIGIDPIDVGLEVAAGGAGGDAGQPGQSGGRGSADQPPSTGGVAGNNSPGAPGAAGADGADGLSQPPGLAAGGSTAVGEVPWAARGSVDAVDGTPGAGGGGGGGGLADPESPENDPGGGGGGGGNGGCPGEGGRGARGGGGSFGLVVFGGSVRLYETFIESGAGGLGGDGGRGGVGRPGGLGGSGGNNSGCGMRCTDGGRGGDGGAGGCGGNAGGAAGGPSLPILRIAAPAGGINASRVLFVESAGSNQEVPNQQPIRDRLLSIGAGGEGGQGGAADGCGDAAQAGPAGVDGEIGCCLAGASCTPGAGAPLACAD